MTAFLIILYILFASISARWIYRWITETLNSTFGWFDWVILVYMCVPWPVSILIGLWTTRHDHRLWDTPIFGPRR